ncbi:MAG: tetratricopeptide repeat protein [Promethearchaeota archaeon]
MPSPRELFQKAFAAALEKKYEDAKLFYRETLTLDPEYSMAWSNLGWILYDQDQNYTEAEECYTKAVKFDKNNFHAWNNYGILFYRFHKNYREAERCWKKSSKIYPDFARVWNNLGVLYKFQLKKPKKSKQCFARAEALAQAEVKIIKSMQAQSTKCVECGNTLVPNQQICDVCGVAKT